MAAPLRPDAILLLATGHWAAGVLKGAVAAGLFTQIARGHDTVVALAKTLPADPTGISVALNALSGLGLLRKESERYSLRPLAEAYLVADSPAYLGELVEVGCGSPYHFEMFADYRRVIEQGKAPEANLWEDDAEFAASLAAALFPMNQPIAERVCEALGWQANDASELSLLDLGRTAGAYGITALARLPNARLELLDFPHVVEAARRFAEQRGVGERLQATPGDLRRAELGGPYHGIFMSQLLHTYAAEVQRQILEKCRAALHPEGRLVIVEFLPDEQRSSNVAALLFETMIYGFSGRTFHTLSSLQDLLAAAGLTVVATEIDGPGGFVIAQAV